MVVLSSAVTITVRVLDPAIRSSVASFGVFVSSSPVIATVALLSFFVAESATESISLPTDAVYVMVFDANVGFSVTVLPSASSSARLLSVASVEAVVLSGEALIAMRSMADAASRQSSPSASFHRRGLPMLQSASPVLPVSIVRLKPTRLVLIPSFTVIQ